MKEERIIKAKEILSEQCGYKDHRDMEMNDDVTAEEALDAMIIFADILGQKIKEYLTKKQ